MTVSPNRFAVFDNGLATIDSDTAQSNADADQAERLAHMTNILARRERTDPAFIGPPRPFHRGQDTLYRPV